MGAPKGNDNAAKKHRLLTSTLVRELTQRPEDALAIANKLIDSAKAGESWAQQLIFERVDGKVPQALVGDDSEAPLRLISRIELVDLERARVPSDTGTPPAEA